LNVVESFLEEDFVHCFIVDVDIVIYALPVIYIKRLEEIECSAAQGRGWKFIEVPQDEVTRREET